MELSEVTLDAVMPHEEARFRDLMAEHHYLGAAPKVGETVWYGARWRGQWVALASFSAAALKCQARDAWIGWTRRHKYDRLHLVVNNTRFLLLRRVPNLGSRVLCLCARQLMRDWPARFHHPLVLLETFVDPSRFAGTVYRAELDRGGPHPGLSPDSGRVPLRLHAEEGLRADPHPPSPSGASQPCAGAPLLSWETERPC